jgi:uracil-DNA glycosylase family 4
MKLIDKIKNCTLCSELAETRKNVVIGEGPIPCNILFLGEAPGEKEDESGRPFVGQSGKLQEALSASMGLKRGVDYHILNILKCRPPENRDPKPEEIENCRKFLEAQIRSIKPKVIVAFGRFAQAFVLGLPASKIQATKRVGEVVDFMGAKVVLTYHPAFVTRCHIPEVRTAFIRHLRKAKKLCAVQTVN